MSFESRDDLRHILVEADYLVERSAGLSYDVFAATRSRDVSTASNRASHCRHLEAAGRQHTDQTVVAALHDDGACGRSAGERATSLFVSERSTTSAARGSHVTFRSPIPSYC